MKKSSLELLFFSAKKTRRTRRVAFILFYHFPVHWPRSETCLRDRPFNLKTWRGGLWFYVSFRKFSSGDTRGRIFFFCRAEREIFFQNLTLGYMTKTLNQIFFFPSTKIRIFFSATLGIRIFFLEKKHNLPPLSS
jgi:hypothetical protein